MDNATEVQRRQDHQLLQDSLNLVAPVADELIASFYDQLFAEHPEVRRMFPADMAPQREKLLKAVIALVTHYDRPEELKPALTALGRTHVRHGVQLDHYAIVGSTLLDSVARFAGPAWNAELAGAWDRAYAFAAGTMMAALALAADGQGELKPAV